MKTIIKLRWLVLAIWIGGLAVLLMTSPNSQSLVREKGGIGVPDGYSSSRANQLLNAQATDHPEQMSIALVFHRDQGLSEEDRDEIEATSQRLQQDKSELGLVSLISPFASKDLVSQLISQDNQTLIVQLGIAPQGRDVAQIREDIKGALGKLSIEHHLTGSRLIDEDVIISSEKGLERTEWITVVFILVVLILVFRSVVAPLIPLIAVGLSYLISQSIVALLVKHLDFPLSNFTQIFMVAVMFGIGTDYCILLLSRFKEELAAKSSKKEAITQTYRTAGKTVFFSGLAALVGFATIGLAHFKLYQSAVAVAVGVAVLLLALLTLTPFFMMLFGKGMFWPSRGKLQHKESKLWGAAGTFSWSRPLLALGIVAIIVAPLLVSYDGKLSFNSLNEIGNGYDSVKGFNRIADSFGPGEAMPTQIVLKSNHRMDTSEDLAVMEKISGEIAKLPDVKIVRSASRPLGAPIQGFPATAQDQIPQEAINQPEFKQILDNYMSKDRTIATIDVVLNENPYSDKALNAIAPIGQTVEHALQGTSLQGATYGIGGITSSYADLRSISDADYKRTVTFMLIGIAIILMVLLRSLVMPIYLIVSLLLCYFTSMAVAELIFTRILNYDGISWTIPFFGFVLLMALGVDYSIFLMDRFNENRHMPVREALLLSMKKMGTVIFSAVIILAGTFAAMLPSGVLSLMQVAAVVLTGLLLYALLFLPFFVSVMVRSFGKANWWPFPHDPK